MSRERKTSRLPVMKLHCLSMAAAAARELSVSSRRVGKVAICMVAGVVGLGWDLVECMG